MIVSRAVFDEISQNLHRVARVVIWPLFAVRVSFEFEDLQRNHELNNFTMDMDSGYRIRKTQ